MQRLKSLIPTGLRSRLRLLRYSGSDFSCPLCGFEAGRMMDAGNGYPMLEELDVVGAKHIPGDICPSCFGSSRARLVWYFASQYGSQLEGVSSLLHVAPQFGVARRLGSVEGLEYVALDGDAERYAQVGEVVQGDLLDLPFPDGRFGAVICNHVLEHVRDDHVAMTEIFRVLRPGGWAILQVPLALKRDFTDEDPSVESEEERIRRFGQHDHVRLYSKAVYLERLAKAGFEVEVLDIASTLSAEAATQWRLNPEEHLYVVRRPLASERRNAA